MKDFLHYQLIEMLGQGGFGEVWCAIDSNNGREVAIKFVKLTKLLILHFFFRIITKQTNSRKSVFSKK